MHANCEFRIESTQEHLTHTHNTNADECIVNFDRAIVRLRGAHVNVISMHVRVQILQSARSVHNKHTNLSLESFARCVAAGE